MVRRLFACILATGLGLVATDWAIGQYSPLRQGSPYSRAPLSPYLNLARGGNPAINYFGLVKPQMDFARQIQVLQMQQGVVLPQMGVPFEEDEAMPTYSITGHTATFGNYSHYYNNGPTINIGKPGQAPALNQFGNK